jgi:hypothetical protein
MGHFTFKPRQSFEIGSVVKIGFVADLEVVKKIATPGDHRPDFYVLWQAEANRFYAFQPHAGGLTRCASLAEAMTAFC